MNREHLISSAKQPVAMFTRHAFSHRKTLQHGLLRTRAPDKTKKKQTCNLSHRYVKAAAHEVFLHPAVQLGIREAQMVTSRFFESDAVRFVR